MNLQDATGEPRADAAGGRSAVDTGEIGAPLFRHVLGHFATGVAVITSLDRGKPVGFTCQSFGALSLDPPLVVFCPSKSSTTWPRIRRSGRFCANVLAADQERLGRSFAVSGADKFADVTWDTSDGGNPVLHDALAWVDGVIESEVEAGDHTIVLGRVRALAAMRDAEPLLFFRGGFGRYRPHGDDR